MWYNLIKYRYGPGSQRYCGAWGRVKKYPSHLIKDQKFIDGNSRCITAWGSPICCSPFIKHYAEAFSLEGKSHKKVCALKQMCNYTKLSYGCWTNFPHKEILEENCGLYHLWFIWVQMPETRNELELEQHLYSSKCLLPPTQGLGTGCPHHLERTIETDSWLIPWCWKYSGCPQTLGSLF